MSKTSAEMIKAQSNGLRGSLAEEVRNGDSGLTEAAKQLIKFHGIYQQQDRDLRKEVRKEGPVAAKAFTFMIRSKLPVAA